MKLTKEINILLEGEPRYPMIDFDNRKPSEIQIIWNAPPHNKAYYYATDSKLIDLGKEYNRLLRLPANKGRGEFEQIRKEILSYISQNKDKLQIKDK